MERLKVARVSRLKERLGSSDKRKESGDIYQTEFDYLAFFRERM